MMAHDQIENLGRVFKLFGRLHDNFDVITPCFRDFVFKKGAEIMKEKRSQLESSEDKKENI